MRTVLRELPALLLIAGFQTAGWALVAGAPALALWTAAVRGPLPPLLLLPAGVAALPVWWALLRALLAGAGRRRSPLPESVPLGRDEAPGLWRTVTALAEATGAPVPARIRLTLRATAGTAPAAPDHGPGAALWRGLRPLRRIRPLRRLRRIRPFRRFRHDGAGRCLYLGVPLLAGLPPGELRAVLCRELAHDSRTADRRFAPAVRRGSAALRELRDELREAGDTHRRTGCWYRAQYRTVALCCRCYDLVSLPVRRRQEQTADALAAAVAGPGPVAAALAGTAVLAAAWEDFRARFLDPMRRAGRVPDEPLRAFAVMLTDPDYAAGLARWREALPATVPGLPRRLERLRRLQRPWLPWHPADPDRGAGAVPAPATAAPAPPVTPGPAVPAEPVPRAAWEGLLGGAPGGAAARPADWDDWADEAAELHVHTALADLHDALGCLPGCPPTLNGVLDLLADGRHEELAAVLADTAWGERQWGELGETAPETALRVLIGRGLAIAGRAGWAVSWLGPPRLVIYDSEAEEAVQAVGEALTDTSAASRLRFLLTLCGVNLALPLDRPPGDWPPPEDSPAPRQALHRGWYVAAGLAGVFLFFGYTAYEPPRTPLSEPTAQQPLPEPSLSVPPAVRDDPGGRAASPSPVRGCPAGEGGAGGCPAAGERPVAVTVRAGDTLWALACRHRTTVPELMAANGLDGTLLRPGQSLTLPAGAGAGAGVPDPAGCG
ncbi:LysM peptidoglycan-binding domain-containing protein [Streptomyces aidingensis]|uniref:LysM domain-containing protein n=1 Tax=Streptomyces aidingensis TaxID=910347 RepID=A0A1I1RI14_9ACTN|nr:LysM peptidoglycan-binding domain-containing protein [Streptomyces aidingensis]SFD33965.1 LysM domain-containing protein [Streptomyces aidingensis]